MNNNKIAIIALVTAIIACFMPVHANSFIPNLGGVTNYDEVDASVGFKLAGTTFFSASGFTPKFGVTYESVNSTSTSATSQTLKLSDVQGYDTVILTPNVGTDTVTFFASSTATTWLPTAGYTQNTCFYNGTTTANVNLIIAGGTGVNVQVASSSATALGSLVIGPQKQGCFTFTRGNTTATTFDISAALVTFL